MASGVLHMGVSIKMTFLRMAKWPRNYVKQPAVSTSDKGKDLSNLAIFS